MTAAATRKALGTKPAASSGEVDADPAGGLYGERCCRFRRSGPHQRDAHAAVLERGRLAEDADVNRGVGLAKRQRVDEALEGEVAAFAIGKDDGAGGRATEIDRRNWQTQDGAQVKFKLVKALAAQSDHASVVRTRRQFGEYGLLRG